MESRITVLEEKAESLEKHTGEMLTDIFNRLRSVERLIYIAMGAVGAVGALATFFGWNILKLLGH